MISSVLGAVIMSAATVAMLGTLNFTNKVLTEVGKDPLSEKERNILIDAGPDIKNQLINHNLDGLCS